LFWFWPTAQKNSTTKNTIALLAAIIYFSTPFGFFAAGFVATDIFLTLGLTLSMVGFWIAMNTETAGHKTSLWHWAFFVGLAIGLLAKGPLTLVLLGLALFVWMLGSPKERFLFMWQKLPWVRGLLLMALIAFPWYILAEVRTPGFLRHFIIGEHIERFFVKDWAGGRFAPSHGEPLGMIWWFAVQSFMPWLLLTVPALFIMWRVKVLASIKRISSETQYLLSWIAAPLVLFTPSRNILDAYMMTALPAFALLLAQLIAWLMDQSKNWRWSMLLAFLMPLAVVTSVVFFYPVLDTQSQRHLLRNWKPGTPLYYVGGVPPSAVFYSANEAKSIESESMLDDVSQLAASSQSPLVVLLDANYLKLSDKEKSKWEKVETYREYTMLRQSRP
jgi:4-amino-4-deoxy-L-arabinose transferase-like glycosyltransferase